MTKNGKMQKVMMRVLMMMLVASFVLASLSVAAQAYWYEECRFHHQYTLCQYFACGYTKYVRAEYHTWMCHDGSGYCYDTGSVCQDSFVGMSTCNNSCP